MRAIVLSILLAGVATLGAQASAQDAAQATDNAELAALYREDQQARANPKGIDWMVLSREDGARRERVLALMREGALRTAADHHHAAMVFQHGQGLQDIRIAHALSVMAMTLAPDEKRYRWLVAASWDRILSTQLQPQWYGTQFQSDEQGLFLYPVAEDAVSDAERVAMGVPTLAESQAKVSEMAASMGQKARPEAPGIEQLREARRGAGPTPP